MSVEPLSDIIMTIYESALAPNEWFKALRRISDFSGSAGCRLVMDDHVGGPVIYSVDHGIESRRVVPRIDVGKSATIAVARELLPIGAPITHSRTSQLAAFVGSQPWDADADAGVSDALSILLLDSSNGRIMLEAMKTGQQEVYTDEELERISLLVPHICRAIRISQHLNANRMTSEMFEASLDALSAGVYFIGQQSRVVHLNRVARAQLKSGRVLRVVDGRLAATGRDAQKLLQSELSAIELDSDGDDRPGRAIALADDEGVGYVAHVLPLQGGARSRIANRFAAFAAIFVQDPATGSSLTTAAFAKLYGLTDGELRFLNGLLPARSIAEAAHLLSISEATAKTHLRHIFKKTRTSKQAELLYLLMTSAPPTSGE
jgi:DNA-binding CsgD family transcriptional regulator